MGNVYTRNPIVVDSFGSDLDIANLAFGSSSVGVFISGFRFYNPTLGDKIVIKDAAGNIVSELKADATGKDVESVGPQHRVHVNSGLKLLAADQTVTTGNLLIYYR